MAAEQLARAGHKVVICEAKPSAGRKFLMAGKSGLNLTKAEPLAGFVGHFAEGADWLEPMLARFGPAEVQDWARGLGVPVFTGTSGRVFPVAMKGSPLLRAWLRRLATLGVELRVRWRWTGFDGGGFVFDTAAGRQVLHPLVTVLALGGASWARLGSDGAWTLWLAAQGVEVAPFQPANIGFAVDWSAPMQRHFGLPVKGVALRAGGLRDRGEFVVSARGIEGSGLYAVSRAMRDGAALYLDLLPNMDLAEVSARLEGRGSRSLSNHLRKALRLDPVKIALLHEFGRPFPETAALAASIKALPVRHLGPHPLDEAISVAGGIRRGAVTDGLELRALPGVFAAGEMLDWEAPTGGYLLTACLATGRWAGQAAAARLAVESG